MIPKFPKFKKLELSDRADIEKITSKFPPYSDFSFTAMWCWDIEGDIRVSKLNDNLVVRLRDDLTRELFFSFIGDKGVSKTAAAIIALAKKEKVLPMLMLIPEETAMKLDAEKFDVREDCDNFDNIYDLGVQANYPGEEYKELRSRTNKLLRKHYKIRVLGFDLGRAENVKFLSRMNKQWAANKELKTFIANENKAFMKLVGSYKEFPLVNVGVLVDDKLVGATVNEKIGRGFAVMHFMACGVNYKEIYPFLSRATAIILSYHGVKYLNHEQSLGLKSLDTWQHKFLKPDFFLKKYIVKIKK